VSAVTFREAAPDDADAIALLMRQYYAEAGYRFDDVDSRAALERLLADPGLGRVLVAQDTAGAVGYVVTTFGFSLEYRGRDAFVDELFVLPSHRGRGLGAAALKLVEQFCREVGVRALHLEAERDNPGAQLLYRGAGFVDHDRRLMTKLLGQRNHRPTGGD
jgi:GNAT superfamily N-acetyltransferase